MNLWPPLPANGILALDISDDWPRAEAVLRRRLHNRSYPGSRFCGKLFAMTEPFWKLPAMQRLNLAITCGTGGGNRIREAGAPAGLCALPSR